MDLNQLYAALEEADKRAQAGDEQAKLDAVELASMIEQYKESATSESEADYINPIVPAIVGGIGGAYKGTRDFIEEFKSPTNQTPIPGANQPKTMFNPRGQSVEQSVENWRNYADAQNEAAKGVRRDTALAKKYPNFQRPPQAIPQEPDLDLWQKARQTARQLPNKALNVTGRGLNRVPGVGVAGGAMAGYQGADAYNRFQEGDVLGGTVSAAGSASSGASSLLGKSNPRLRALGLIGGAVAPLVNKGIDKLKGEPEEKAMGGVVGYNTGNIVKGGKAVKGGLEAAKKLFDPRFDKRVLEQEKLANQVLHTERTGPKDIPRVYLPDYEGYPVITSMSDRSAAGTRLKGINSVMFNQPVDLPGGQEFMYGDMAWASGINPVNQIMEEAVQLKKKTGKDPLYAPWRMAPTGSDFAHMTGETMLAYAQSAMGKSEKKDLDNLVKKFIPDWAGIDDPRSMQQFVYAPSKVRKSVQKAMDRDLRDAGSIGLGEARLAIADPAQINAPEGGLMHIAKIHADKPIIEASGHPSYPKGVPGEGLGRIEGDFMATQILPQMVKERGIKDVLNPSAQDIRALQMKPYSTIMDDKLLKALGFAEGGEVQRYNAGSAVKGLKTKFGFLKPSAKSHSQDPTVARALEEYLKGNISQEERIAIMNKQLPLRPWTQMPPAYSDEQIKMALMENKRPKALVDVPAGARVGNRLDIPAYTQHGVYVDTTHDLAKGNSPISYNRTGHLKDVEFSSKPNQAVRVGLGTKEQALTPMGAEMGSAKSPFALIKGTNQGTSDEEVRRMMAELMKDPNYAQIGMDPRRHSQFYDKSTGMPVWAAEEKLQSGPLILVPKRGLETTSWDDPRLNLSDFSGKKYAAGGVLKKGVGALKQMFAPKNTTLHPDFETFHPKVQKALTEGKIHPDDAQWMSDYSFTPGSSSTEIETGVYAGTGNSERMANYLGRIKNKEVTNPWPGNEFAEGGSSTPAWQRSEGKNPEGGLNAAGRASYNRETGGNLKAPQPEGGSRKKSFCARMSGMKKKLTSSETANDPDSRINKSLRKWKC